MSALLRTLTGKNRTGAIIFAIMDVLPVPSIHEVIKAVLSKDAPKNAKEFWTAFKDRVDYLRLTAGIMVSTVLIWLMFKGAIPPEQVAELLQAVLEVLTQ